MARINVSQATVLDAVVARLISQIPDFNAANCFISAVPSPELQNAHNLFCTVWVTEGKFDESIIEGAGQEACAENAGVLVTVSNKVKLDQKHHHKMILEEASRGLLVLKRLILKALVVHDLATGSDTFLRNLTMPTSSPQPGYDEKAGVAWLPIVFSTDFDWDLS